ncbi:helix-turn-helix transcriptional regulator [Gluconobacter sphaericus]|uniref:helix-turn-helix domain-containing protein n=1 Tax=Gluconobacter sphaericus TaxID=574987 RepID=UPI001B8B80CD|nr:helix-turn-helix transcriptional regulator [Gluconobacter sphaericus]MBS1098643.1 helix-turn-helix transcriptional regulator [Gluconobacter sphaericus]
MSNIHGEEYQELLKKIKSARKDAQMTQVQVAIALNLTQSFISKLESGERRIDPIELKILAKIYKKPITFFY